MTESSTVLEPVSPSPPAKADATKKAPTKFTSTEPVSTEPASTREHPEQAGLIWLYLAVMTVAELLSAGTSLVLGLTLHAATLLFLFVRFVLSGGKKGDFYLALSVIPLIRILSLTMPIWLVNPTNWLPLVNLPLIIATLVAAKTLGYGLKDLRLNFGPGILLQLLIASSGFLIGYLERFIIQPAALAPGLELGQVLWPMLSLLLFTGLSEELLFRGLLLTAVVRYVGARRGILFAALVFGAFHFGWQSWLDVAFVTLVGVYFGWLVHKTRSIFGVTLAHGIANIMLFVVLPNL